MSARASITWTQLTRTFSAGEARFTLIHLTRAPVNTIFATSKTTRIKRDSEQTDEDQYSKRLFGISSEDPSIHDPSGRTPRYQPPNSLNAAYDALKLPVLPSTDSRTREHFVRLATRFVLETYSGWLTDFRAQIDDRRGKGSFDRRYNEGELAQTFFRQYGVAIWDVDGSIDTFRGQFRGSLENFFAVLRRQHFMYGGYRENSTIYDDFVDLVGQDNARIADVIHETRVDDAPPDPELILSACFAALRIDDSHDASMVTTLFRSAVAQIAFEVLNTKDSTPATALGPELTPSNEPLAAIVRRVAGRYARSLWAGVNDLPCGILELLAAYVSMLISIPLTRSDLLGNIPDGPASPVGIMDKYMQLQGGDAEEARSRKMNDPNKPAGDPCPMFPASFVRACSQLQTSWRIICRRGMTLMRSMHERAPERQCISARSRVASLRRSWL